MGGGGLAGEDPAVISEVTLHTAMHGIPCQCRVVAYKPSLPMLVGRGCLRPVVLEMRTHLRMSHMSSTRFLTAGGARPLGLPNM